MILLVEDDPSLLAGLDEFLRRHGYRTLLASTVREAVEYLQTEQPPLCVVDLNLPDGSGLEIIRRVARLGHCRLVVMTAFDLEHQRPVDASHVLAGWLRKPVDPQELLALLNAQLAANDEAPPAYGEA
jgi:DNA-binding response OmpR family regulator